MSYLDSKNEEVKEYFKILCNNDFPEWIWEYVNTPEMQRIDKISMSCGTDYSKCFDIKYWYSNLDHSIGVALVIWNFTHDKKQTLAGLFHDIATPVFKHCIDFMNGDSEKQESTEELTTDFIVNSKEIMALLKRDGIKLEEVNDYKKYPIADNDTPMLSADRFEYTFASGLTFFRVWELDKIKKTYENIIVVKNELGLDELAFKDKEVCEEYIDIISKLWPEWVSVNDRTVMQFLADMCKSMKNAGYLTIDDLYKLSEQEVIDKILGCDDPYLKNSFLKFTEVNKAYSSLDKVLDKYCVNVKSKARYVIPLVKTNDGPVRINKISEKAARQIEEYLNSPKSGFTYFDFNFKPYETELTKYTSRDCNITMQDIYSEVNYYLRKNDFHNIDSISERKRLVNEELKKYVISKILELDSNISISDEMDLYFLVELLGRLIPKEEHFDTIRHLIHFVLQIASDMQGWYIVWYVKESNSYINNPEILKYNEMWDTLKTHQDENLVQTFKFVYDTFENHFMEKHHIKDYE